MQIHVHVYYMSFAIKTDKLNCVVISKTCFGACSIGPAGISHLSRSLWCLDTLDRRCAFEHAEHWNSLQTVQKASAATLSPSAIHSWHCRRTGSGGGADLSGTSESAIFFVLYMESSYVHGLVIWMHWLEISYYQRCTDNTASNFVMTN